MLLVKQKHSQVTRSLCLWVFILCLSQQLKAQYTDIINSNRPGNSIGAYSVGKGVYQVESSFYVDKIGVDSLMSSTLYNNGILSFRFGILHESLELSYDGAYTVAFSTSPKEGEPVGVFQGFYINRLGTKYMLYDPFRNPNNRPINVRSWRANKRFKFRNLLPAVAVYAGANLSIENNPYFNKNISVIQKTKTTARAMLVTQSTLTPKMVLILNGIYDFIGSETLEEKVFIASLSHALKPKWSVFIEGQYSIYKEYEDQIFRAGGAYLLNKNIQIDIFGGLNFNESNKKETVGLGFSYRLDKHKN